MHIEWESPDWSGARVDPALTCLSWAPAPPIDTNNNASSSTSCNDNRSDGECGWLGTGAINGTVGITRTRLHPPHEDALHTNAMDGRERINYNLRGHSSQITFVVWNRQPLKLASCDENGMIYVWVPYEDRWSVELVNERSVRVRHFCWSPSGHAALIVYEDNFVLIGSATGNRIWSHTYEPVTKRITCGAWSSDSRQVLLATDVGTVNVLSDQGMHVTEVTHRNGIRIDSLVWSQDTLAITFVDGIVYLLKSYDDVDATPIEAGLVITSTQWSMNGRYLAIVGRHILSDRHRLLIFDGDGRRRLAHDVAPSPANGKCAFTWAHDDQAVIFGIGGELRVARLVFTVPSLRHMCSYRVFGCLGVDADDKVDRLPLASRERRLVLGHSYHIIQCRVPSERTLQRAVSYPTEWRWYCTIRPASGATGTASAHHNSYILYMEHGGSLVPILSARLTSRLLPEFQIQLCTPSSILAQSSTTKRDNFFYHPQSTIELSSDTHTTPTVDGGNQFIDVDDMPPIPFVRGVHAYTTANLGARTSQMWRRSKRQFTAFMQRQFRSPSASPSAGACASSRRQRRQSMKMTTTSTANDTSNELLVQVSSNVWCTRFKVAGLDCDLLPAYLGHVTYKTSVLHLQPRQMTVHVVDLKHRNAKMVAIDAVMDGDDMTEEDASAVAVAPTDGELFVRPRRQQQPAAPTQSQINVSQALSEFNELRTTCIVHLQTLRAYRSTIESSIQQMDRQRSTVGSVPQHSAQILKKLTMQLKLQHPSTPPPPPPPPQNGVNHHHQRRRSSPTTSTTDCTWTGLMDDLEFIDDDDAILMKAARHNARSSTSTSCSTSDRATSVPASSMHHHGIPSTSCTDASPTIRCEDHQQRLRNVTLMIDRLQQQFLPLLDQSAIACRRPVPLYTAPQFDVGRMRQRVDDLDRRLAAIEGYDQPDEQQQQPTTSSLAPILNTWSVVDGTINSVLNDLRQRTNQLRLCMRERAFDRPRASKPKQANTVRQSLRRAKLFGAAKDSVSASEFATDAAHRPVDVNGNEHVIVLQNKTPFWNEQSQVYQLDFGGRVTQESAKNFQIEYEDIQVREREDNTRKSHYAQVMQFGRIESGCYTLDFQAPFSAVQAFAVALASITQRLK